MTKVIFILLFSLNIDGTDPKTALVQVPSEEACYEVGNAFIEKNKANEVTGGYFCLALPVEGQSA